MKSYEILEKHHLKTGFKFNKFYQIFIKFYGAIKFYKIPLILCCKRL